MYVYGKKFSLSVKDLAHAQYGHMIPMTLLESLLSLRRHQTFDWVELVYSDFQFGNTTPAILKHLALHQAGTRLHINQTSIF